MPQVRVVEDRLVGGQARERQSGRTDPRTVLLGREEADAVAACAQPERQREERKQVAGRADGDDDEVNGFDAGLLAESWSSPARIRHRLEETLPMRL
jgi:hypothetical protein